MSVSVSVCMCVYMYISSLWQRANARHVRFYYRVVAYTSIPVYGSHMTFKTLRMEHFMN